MEELEPRTVPAGGTWTPLLNLAPDPFGIGTILLLSDGTVMAQGESGPGGTFIGGASANWYKLTPDSSGSYINGTWSQLASMSIPRLYFTSDVLQDGRVFVLGGEYSGSMGTQFNAGVDNTGEIYDPVSNTWTPTATFPQSQFADDPSETLPNGTILLGYLQGPQTYIYDPKTNSYTQTGTKLRNDQSDEEAWVKLPDGSILSYDIFASNEPNPVLPGHAQRYIPSTGQWVDAGAVPESLSSATIGFELGPAILLPDGRVWQIGGNSNTVFYNPSTNTWTPGPTIPNGMGADDAPAAILPDGDVIFAADTPLFMGPTQLYDFDYRTNTITPVATPAPLTAQLNNPAFIDRLMILPSGQLLLTTSNDQLWVFTPNGGPQDVWRPTISNVVNNGNGTFTLTGTQLTGISEGSNYGDDVENATNYPIVQITDTAGHVLYARTFDWSSTGVAQDGTPQSVQFTLPAGLAPGALSLVVIANGIPSQPFVIPAAAPIRVFYPLRYSYNHRTGLYSGVLTVSNPGTAPVTGQFDLLILGLPPGVTLANPTGIAANGAPFIRFVGTLVPNVPLHFVIRFRDLRHRHHARTHALTTFYIGFPVLLLVNPFADPAPTASNPLNSVVANLVPQGGVQPAQLPDRPTTWRP